MKKFNLSSNFKTLLIIILALLFTQLHSQETKKRKPYQVKIVLVNGQRTKGILNKVNESSLELVKSINELTELEVVEVSKIKSLAIRKKGSIGGGFILGAFIGVVVSVVILKQAYPTEPSSSIYDANLDLTPVFIGILITSAGGTIGAATYGKKTYKINGDQSTFDLIRDKLTQHQWLQH